MNDGPQALKIFFRTGDSYIIFNTTNAAQFEFYIANGIRALLNNSGDFNVTGVVRSNGVVLTSDDRIKNNESIITDATATINKLRPEIYDKYQNFDCSGNFTRESGLVAQEVWNVPELRHLVNVPEDADVSNLVTIPSNDPNVDPDYSAWGTTSASLNYTGLIPYLIKSIQELDATIQTLQARIAILESKP